MWPICNYKACKILNDNFLCFIGYTFLKLRPPRLIPPSLTDGIMPPILSSLRDVVLYRRGGLHLTQRWDDGDSPRDLDDWDPSEPAARLIEVRSGVCGEPIVLSVRYFIPKEGDILDQNSSMLKPYAIESISTAAEGFENYIRCNATASMEYTIAKNVLSPLICETFSAALAHHDSLDVRLYLIHFHHQLLTEISTLNTTRKDFS